MKSFGAWGYARFPISQYLRYTPIGSRLPQVSTLHFILVELLILLVVPHLQSYNSTIVIMPTLWNGLQDHNCKRPRMVLSLVSTNCWHSLPFQVDDGPWCLLIKVWWVHRFSLRWMTSTTKRSVLGLGILQTGAFPHSMFQSIFYLHTSFLSLLPITSNRLFNLPEFFH